MAVSDPFLDREDRRDTSNNDRFCAGRPSESSVDAGSCSEVELRTKVEGLDVEDCGKGVVAGAVDFEEFVDCSVVAGLTNSARDV